ncbi:MAG: moeA [Frondihabitans sp.]|nr:moeA [Frondihabitans sp.]
MRTIEEHAAAVAELVGDALARPRIERLRVDASDIGQLASYRWRVLAADVIAPLDLPPFDNSQMDGYAVDSRALAAGAATLRVGPRIPAGRFPPPLEAGTAAPIMTGAVLPDGADAVVPIEAADPARFLPENTTSDVVLPGPVPAEQFVRRIGTDVRAGETLLVRGTVLRPAHWGILAASGVEVVDVVAKPRILVVSTGSELAPAGGGLGAAEIHDANGASLSAALAESGAEVLLHRVSDDAETLLDVIRKYGGGDTGLDLVVTTGGVSAGAYEVVRDAFEGRGVRFESVAMQPGGPQGWGLLDSGDFTVPVVCFPGNPVSTLVSFEAFLRVPLLAAGRRPQPRRDAVARLAEAADSPPGKHQIRRGRLDADGRVHLVGGPSSHLLHSYARSNVLAHIPLGVAHVEAGDEVVVWALDD